MIRLGSSSRKAAHDVWRMCSRDLLFYINTFCYTYDPRKEPSALPFITYDFQDTALQTINESINNEDLCIEKTRDMGASWMVLMVYEWRWHFRDLQAFLCASRVEDLVDSTENPDALFWKIDFVHRNQPKWLLPAMTRQQLHIGNTDNGSSIDGCSTTGDMGRAGRRTSVFLDEFGSVPNGYEALAATADVTKCRIFLSTPKGTSNAFYKIVKSPTKKLRLHWTMHPEKSKGLYTAANGKSRSPWYDAECKRRDHPQEIAQELDIDYLGSDYQFFNPGVLDSIQGRDVRSPYMVGELDYDVVSDATSETLTARKFSEVPGGRLRLWMRPNDDGSPPAGDYCIGADISAGTGSSNSVLSVANRKTGEKVAELASPNLDPTDLGRYAVALARWLGGAYLIWEANGPGRSFGNKVIHLGYRNVYHQTNERSLSKKTTDTPGWWATPENKEVLLTEYRQSLKDSKFINRSYDAVEECRQYVFFQNGTIGHSASANNIDPTGARNQHGDRVIADALACKAVLSRPVIVEEKAEEIPVGSLAWRRQQAEDAARRKDLW